MISSKSSNPVLSPKLVPERTRYRIRDRVYSRGLVRDIVLPDPAVLGRPLFLIVICELYAERSEDVLNRWRAQREAVHILASANFVLGVFFARNTADANSILTRAIESRDARSEFHLSCDTRLGSIPVYFDFEGTWVSANGLTGCLSYPRHLPSSTFTQLTTPRSLARRDELTLLSMLARPALPTPPNWPFARLRRPAWAARERRLCDDGVVEPRTVLDPIAWEVWSQNAPQSLVLVSGSLLDGKAPSGFFSELVQESWVTPFLFVTNGRQVVFAYLSTGIVMAAPQSTGPTNSLVALVRRSLSGIVVLRDQLSAFTTVLNHQYNRPFSPGDRVEPP